METKIVLRLLERYVRSQFSKPLTHTRYMTSKKVLIHFLGEENCSNKKYAHFSVSRSFRLNIRESSRAFAKSTVS